ncbi:MAG TPA: transglutaminase domain-containing protein, partial [Nitrospirae bacterium]|nr:transglutaminase domain-containing protein [Nitrospirota bacterium]
EESPLGFTLIAEPMAEAVNLPGLTSDVSDIILLTSVPFNIDLPEDISFLKMQIKGIDFEGFDLNGGRQSLKGDIVEINTEDIAEAGHVSLPVSGMDRFLEDSPFIQSKALEIVKLSREILGGEKDSLAAARKLWLWVYTNIEKKPSITLPSAVDVLKIRQGDCNEHTALYTALARAAGLPARISTGLVYRDGYFYYHAWPEVFTGQWIDIDPTLGQFPADATHLRLVRGDMDKQLILLRAINNIALIGIEYK